MADKDIKYTDEVLRSIASKVAKDLIEDSSDMQRHVLLEVTEALDRGEDVYGELVNSILARPFMERFIAELIKYENEKE